MADSPDQRVKALEGKIAELERQVGRKQEQDKKLIAPLCAVEAECRPQERAIHKRCGLEKLYYLIQPDWMGRDRFCSLLMNLGYGVGKVKNYRRTTYPVSSRYEYLIEGMVVSRREAGRPWQVQGVEKAVEKSSQALQ